MKIKYFKTVEAEQWQPGTAVDGVLTDPDQIGAPTIKAAVKAAAPGQLAAMKTFDGWKAIKPGDYVITQPNGDITVMDGKSFESNYRKLQSGELIEAVTDTEPAQTPVYNPSFF